MESLNRDAARRAEMPAPEVYAEVERRIGPTPPGPDTLERRNLLRDTIRAILVERYDEECLRDRAYVAFRAKSRAWFRKEALRAL